MLNCLLLATATSVIAQPTPPSMHPARRLCRAGPLAVGDPAKAKVLIIGKGLGTLPLVAGTMRWSPMAARTGLSITLTQFTLPAKLTHCGNRGLPSPPHPHTPAAHAAADIGIIFSGALGLTRAPPTLPCR